MSRPRPGDHLVQTYTDDAFLVGGVAEWVGRGLGQGEAAVVIATPEHVEALRTRLADEGLDVTDAIATSRLLLLDARHTLAQCMVAGAPDGPRFAAILGSVLDRVRAAGHATIRCFGEMVDLLWATNLAATVRLEELWNEAMTTHGISLLCAYRLDPFERRIQGVLHRVGRCHSHLMPAEAPAQFDEAVDRAYREVFGRNGDPATLHRLIASRQPARPAMSTAQAALLSLHELSPVLSAAVLERGRVHYVAGRR